MAAPGAFAKAATYKSKSTVISGESAVTTSRSAASVNPNRLKDAFPEAFRLATKISLLISINDRNVSKNLDRWGSAC